MRNRIRNILLEAFHSKDYYSQQFEMEIMDELNIEGYSLVLLKFVGFYARNFKMFGFPVYSIALEKDGMDFTDAAQQFEKTKLDSNVNFLKVVRETKKKISEWLDKYGKIAIGSFNDDKIKKYNNLLTKMGFVCEKEDTKHLFGIDTLVISN